MNCAYCLKFVGNTAVRDLVGIVHKNAEQSARVTLGNIFNEAYYRSMYDVQSRLGYAFYVDKAPDDKLKSLQENVSFQGYADRLSNELARILANSQNATQEETNAAIGEAFSSGYDKLMSWFASNEVVLFANEVVREGYENSRVQRYRIVGENDGKTCEICSAMNDQEFAMSEYEVGTTAPPFHQTVGILQYL